MATPPVPQKQAIRTSEERNEQAARKRPLFGVRTTKGDVEYEIPGYHLAYVTDYEDGRLQYALECGYTFVTPKEIGLKHTESDVAPDKDTSDRISQRAGMSESGKPIRRFLMKIPNEYYEEAQQAINEQSDRLENQLYSGDHTEVGNKYIPTSVQTKIGSKIVR